MDCLSNLLQLRTSVQRPFYYYSVASFSFSVYAFIAVSFGARKRVAPRAIGTGEAYSKLDRKDEVTSEQSSILSSLLFCFFSRQKRSERDGDEIFRLLPLPTSIFFSECHFPDFIAVEGEASEGSWGKKNGWRMEGEKRELDGNRVGGEIDVDGGDGGRKSEWLGGSPQTLLAISL